MKTGYIGRVAPGEKYEFNGGIFTANFHNGIPYITLESGESESLKTSIEQLDRREWVEVYKNLVDVGMSFRFTGKALSHLVTGKIYTVKAVSMRTGVAICAPGLPGYNSSELSQLLRHGRAPKSWVRVSAFEEGVPVEVVKPEKFDNCSRCGLRTGLSRCSDKRIRCVCCKEQFEAKAAAERYRQTQIEEDKTMAASMAVFEKGARLRPKKPVEVYPLPEPRYSFAYGYWKFR